jgi:hypothetical protein
VDWIAIAGLLNGENARPLGEVRIVLDHLRVGKRSDDLSHAEAICRELIISVVRNLDLSAGCQLFDLAKRATHSDTLSLADR